MIGNGNVGATDARRRLWRICARPTDPVERTPGKTTLDVLCRAEDSDPDEGGERLTPQAGVCAATPCCGVNRRETTLWRRGLPRRSALAVPWRIEFADQAHFERPRVAVPPSPQFNDPPFEHGQQNRMVDLAVGGLPASVAIRGVDFGVSRRTPPLPQALRGNPDVGQSSIDGYGIEARTRWQVWHRKPAERSVAVSVQRLLVRLGVVFLRHELQRPAVWPRVQLDFGDPRKIMTAQRQHSVLLRDGRPYNRALSTLAGVCDSAPCRSNGRLTRTSGNRALKQDGLSRKVEFGRLEPCVQPSPGVAVTAVRPPSRMAPRRRRQVPPENIFDFSEARPPLGPFERSQMLAETTVFSCHGGTIASSASESKASTTSACSACPPPVP